jgi:hypothetical protein
VDRVASLHAPAMALSAGTLLALAVHAVGTTATTCPCQALWIKAGSHSRKLSRSFRTSAPQARRVTVL